MSLVQLSLFTQQFPLCSQLTYPLCCHQYAYSCNFVSENTFRPLERKTSLFSWAKYSPTACYFQYLQFLLVRSYVSHFKLTSSNQLPVILPLVLYLFPWEHIRFIHYCCNDLMALKSLQPSSVSLQFFCCGFNCIQLHCKREWNIKGEKLLLHRNLWTGLFYFFRWLSQ